MSSFQIPLWNGASLRRAIWLCNRDGDRQCNIQEVRCIFFQKKCRLLALHFCHIIVWHIYNTETVVSKNWQGDMLRRQNIDGCVKILTFVVSIVWQLTAKQFQGNVSYWFCRKTCVNILTTAWCVAFALFSGQHTTPKWPPTPHRRVPPPGCTYVYMNKHTD